MNVALLKEICEESGAPGFEEKIRKIVLREIESLVDEFSVDNMGNIIAVKKGTHAEASQKRVMCAAHMDEIGFIVTHIDDKGFLKFHTLGGFDPKTLTSQRVIVHGTKDLIGVMGAKPIHVMSPEERNLPVKMEAFYIDLGLLKEEVVKYIKVGDSITRDRELIEMGNNVNCKSLDNRVSVYILIEALKTLKNKTIPYDFYAAFTVQEEVGLRGANVASHTVNPYFGIGLDTTIAYDVPGAAAHEYVTELGKGTAVKIMDASTICDTRMVRYMKQVAEKNNIQYQTEILTAGGTDTAGIQRMGKNGSIAGAISIPTRHIHQVIEMCSKSDIDNSIALLSEVVASFEDFDFQY